MPMPFGLRRLWPPSEELIACRRKRHLLRGCAWPLLAMKMRVLAVGCAALSSTILLGNQLLQVRVNSQGVPACSCQKLRHLRDAFPPSGGLLSSGTVEFVPLRLLALRLGGRGAESPGS